MDLDSYLARWPKVDLHRHLEGTVRPDTAVEWAQRSPTLKALPSEELWDKIQFDGVTGFAHFLSKFVILRELYYDPAAIQQVAREAVIDAAADNIRYLELRFSPDHFARQAGFDFHEVTALILRAAKEEADRQDITLRFLCTIGRGYDRPTADLLLDIALTFRHEGIVGVDLAGDELRYPAAPFIPLMEGAAAEGLGITVHAGEVGPPEHLWEAIDSLQATRIGHGIRSVEDSELLAALKERDILLEVCPTSNLHTGAVVAADEHPLVALIRAGVPVGVSSDDPAISRITLGEEYRFALEAGLERGELAESVICAARHAFLPKNEKECLVQRLQQELEEAQDLPFQPS